MKIQFHTAALKQTKWHEYAIRFLLGGTITVIAGLIAKGFGPIVGGLFLAFPAIFPASASLIEKHEKQKKQKVGLKPGHRGTDAAALDAAGATMGSIGLLTFAAVMWKFLPGHSSGLIFALANIAWLAVSVAIWATCGKIGRSPTANSHYLERKSPDLGKNNLS